MKRKFGILLVACLLMGLLPVWVQGADLQVPAKSALLMELETGTVLYEANAHEPLAPASVTKIMTMLLIMEAIDAGSIGWEDTVTASETAAAKGGSQVYLKVGETMTVRDMVKSIAVSSANDCACAMAEHLAGSEEAFVARMNQRAGELGMENTHFVNCTGLDDDPAAKDHRTSAYDIALMSRELMVHHPDIAQFTTIWMDTIRDGTFGLSNTNKMVRFYQGATGLKTGFTSGAGYCLSATARREEMGLVAVVMGSDTSKERFAACKQLLDYGFANFALVKPEPEESLTVPVTLGKETSVTAVPSESGTLLVDKGQKNAVSVQVDVSPGVKAPVSRGQRLGTMTIRSGEQVLKQIPLVATQTVEKLGWWEIFTQVLRRLSFSKISVGEGL